MAANPDKSGKRMVENPDTSDKRMVAYPDKVAETMAGILSYELKEYSIYIYRLRL